MGMKTYLFCLLGGLGILSVMAVSPVWAKPVEQTESAAVAETPVVSHAGRAEAGAETSVVDEATAQDAAADEALAKKAEEQDKEEAEARVFCSRSNDLAKQRLADQKTECASMADDASDEQKAMCKKVSKCVFLAAVEKTTGEGTEQFAQKDEDLGGTEATLKQPKAVTTGNTRIGAFAETDTMDADNPLVQNAVMRSGDAVVDDAVATGEDRDLILKGKVTEDGFEIVDAKLTSNQAYVTGMLKQAESDLQRMGYKVDPDALRFAAVKSGVETSMGAGAVCSNPKPGRLDCGTFNHYSRPEISRLITKLGLPWSVDDVLTDQSIQSKFAILHATDLLSIADQTVASAGASYSSLYTSQGRPISRDEVAYALNTGGTNLSLTQIVDRWSTGRFAFVGNWYRNSDDFYAIANEALNTDIVLSNYTMPTLNIGGSVAGNGRGNINAGNLNLASLIQNPTQSYANLLMAQYGYSQQMGVAPYTMAAYNPNSGVYNGMPIPASTGVQLPLIIIDGDTTTLKDDAPQGCGGQVINLDLDNTGLLRPVCVEGLVG